MHHKRNRSVRREVKRMDEKSYRAAEARALYNIEHGPPDNPRVDSWGYRPEPLPLGDIPCNGKNHSKRKRPKKKRCPVNGTHEWYKEWIEATDHYYPWDRCDVCGAWHCILHNHPIYYNVKTYKATCIHCWEAKVLKTETDRWTRKPGYSRWCSRKLVLPKRPVKF